MERGYGRVILHQQERQFFFLFGGSKGGLGQEAEQTRLCPTPWERGCLLIWWPLASDWKQLTSRRATSPEERRQPRTGRQKDHTSLSTSTSHSPKGTVRRLWKTDMVLPALVYAKPNIPGNNTSSKCTLHFKIFKRHPFFFLEAVMYTQHQ